MPISPAHGLAPDATTAETQELTVPRCCVCGAPIFPERVVCRAHLDRAAACVKALDGVVDPAAFVAELRRFQRATKSLINLAEILIDTIDEGGMVYFPLRPADAAELRQCAVESLEELKP